MVDSSSLETAVSAQQPALALPTLFPSGQRRLREHANERAGNTDEAAS